MSFLLYYKARRKQAGAVSWRVARFIPLVLYALLLLRLALPWRRRRFWWATVRNVVLAPCARVGFAENFVADVLTSLPKVLTQVTTRSATSGRASSVGATSTSCGLTRTAPASRR